MTTVAQRSDYLGLLRRNKPFRQLWYGQIVSQLGDWFNAIALFTLLLKLTGSGAAVGLLLVAEMLPATLVGPWAGVLVDRLPRRLVMVAADVGRALLVLPLLLVRDANDIWIIYVCTVGKVVLAAFFEPARSATIPMVTDAADLVTANAISGATWSAMLAIGAALGGLVAGTLGTTAAFIIDACSFLLSAVIIVRIPIVETHLAARAARPRVAGGDMREGLTFLARHPQALLYTSIKGLWSLGAGVLLVLTLLGRGVFPLGVDGALSIGLLYAARGLGAAIGPFLAQRVFGTTFPAMRSAIAPAVALTGLGYVLASQAPTLWLAALAVMLAHLGGSTQWVFSTVLLQLSVPDQLRGRVFAIELALMTLATAASSYTAGWLSDAGWGARDLAMLFGSIYLAPALLLVVLLRRAPLAVGAPTEG